MAKRFLSLSLLLTAASSIGAHAQNTVLRADTAMTTHSSGVGRFSALFEPTGNSFGILNDRVDAAWVAEDFTIPASTTWAIDSVIVYGYQTGAGPTTSTFTSAYAQVFNGMPGSPAAIAVAGDTTTNRLAGATWSGIYRVDTISNTTGLTRPIMRVAMTGFPNVLAAGTYWLAWSTEGTLASGPWANPKVSLTGGVPSNPAGQNAMSRFGGSGSIWRPAKDSTSPTANTQLGFNYMLKGRINPTSVNDVSASAFKLNDVFPNPASGTTNISFSLAQKSRVSVHIMNAAGQRVAKVVEDELTTGDYMIPFSTANLASGIYRVMLQTEAGSTQVPLTVK